jgi:uncharacterized protein (TIGR04255 family)
VQSALSAQYNCRREDLISFTARSGPEGMAVARNQTGQFRVHFSIEKHITAFVYPDRISFHWQGKYPGWDVFQLAFKAFWTKLLKVNPEITSGRIGVRFINIINEKTPDQEVGHWLKPAVNYPEGLLSSKGGYFYSIRRPLKLERHVQLFVAEGELKNGGNRPLILDIDVQSDNAIQRVSSQTELLTLIDDLHEEAVSVFESSITRNYLDLLNKGVI